MQLMQQTLSKRIIALLVAVLLALAMLPAQAFAAATAKYSITIIGAEEAAGKIVSTTWIPKTSVSDASGKSALAVLKEVATTNGYKVDTSLTAWGTSLDKITKPDGSTSADPNNDGWWAFYVNGEQALVGSGDYVPKNNDLIAFRFEYWGSTELNTGDTEKSITINPDAARPNYTAQTAGYTKGRIATTTSLPISAKKTKAAFKARLLSSWGMQSDLLVVNKNVYVAYAKAGTTAKLRIIKGSTGAKVKEVDLSGKLDYLSRPVYTNGLVIVPLAGGRLQALTANTLTTVWVTDALPNGAQGAQQSLSSLVVSGNNLYFATTVANASTSSSGYVASVNTKTGALNWRSENTAAGYYWSGAVAKGSLIYVTSDNGTIYALNKKTGNTMASKKLKAPVRSTLVAKGTNLYAVDTKGYLNRISTIGILGAVKRIKVASSSTSLPVISGSKLYVGAASSKKGVLAIVDLAKFKVYKKISVAAEVKGAPLVVKAKKKTYVYFTYNKKPGGVMVYKLGNKKAQALYKPTGKYANYSVSSVYAGAGGKLYFANDSGTVFGLKKK